MISDPQNDAALRRLTRGRGKPKPPAADWPSAIMEVSGPSLGQSKPTVLWQQKYGVWFFVHWDKPLESLEQWGFTMPAFLRMCSRLGYTFRWISPAPFPFSSAPNPVRGAALGTTAHPAKVDCVGALRALKAKLYRAMRAALTTPRPRLAPSWRLSLTGRSLNYALAKALGLLSFEPGPTAAWFART